MNQNHHPDVDKLVPGTQATSSEHGAATFGHQQVLEAAEQSSRLAVGPTSVLCPGCGDVVTRFPSGFPARLTRFAEVCTECDVELWRWCVVATAAACETRLSDTTLRQTTTGYWDRNLWDGILTGEDNPRTAEYSKQYTATAAAFGWDWSVTCPLCRRSVSDIDSARLEYHHWQRDPDQGVCLCRTCHEALSGGVCDGDLDWQAQQLGLKNKHDLQVTRLAFREQAVQPRASLTALADCIRARYNLIQSDSEVSAILNETLGDSAVQDQVSDGYLLAGLPTESDSEPWELA